MKKTKDMTEEERIRRNEYQRAWRNAHKEQVQHYNRKHLVKQRLEAQKTDEHAETITASLEDQLTEAARKRITSGIDLLTLDYLEPLETVVNRFVYLQNKKRG